MKRPLAVAAMLTLVACTDMSKYSTEAQKLVAQYGPQIAALLKDNEALLSKVKALPQTFPGVGDLVSKVVANRDKLDGMKQLVDGFQGKLAAALKQGKQADLTAMLASFKKGVADGLAEAGVSMKALTDEAGVLQSKVSKVAGFEKQLPGGFALKGSPTGVESQLVGFVEDAGRPVDETTWFDFDRVLFKTGSAEIDRERSSEQLGNLVEILKAYPALQLKVGGYTDNVGNAAANQKLSAARAQAVVSEVVARGVAPERLAAQGYGSEHPICAANDTPECREKNRRVSVRVTHK